MKINAHDLALKFLNSRDRTAFEIRKHLKSKAVSRELIDECVEYLIECKLIDDEDYCDRYIIYGIGKGKGPLRLERELLEKGISGEMVNTALDAHFGHGEEFNAAIAYVEKQLRQQGYLQFSFNNEEGEEFETGSRDEGTRPIFDEKELAKIGRRLAYQGYHSHIIYGIIDRLRGWYNDL